MMDHEGCLQSLAGIIESLAFLMPLGPAEADPADGLSVEVPWHGPDGSHGVVLIALDLQTADAIAINMLGLAPGEQPAGADRLDAARELANVIAGNLLPAYYGGDHEFHLAAPRGCTPRALTGRPVLRLTLIEGVMGVSVESEAENSRILKAVTLPSGGP